MGLEDQDAIKQTAEQLGRDSLVVVLGAPDPDACRLYTETLIYGDPTYAGPLAGVQLGLSVYSIFEDEVKQSIPEDTYRQYVSMMELVLPVDQIRQEVRRVREGPGI